MIVPLMATRRKTKAKKLKFELTRGSVGGIAVVVFCLFLWMFLLGVWAGQSLLVPTFGINETTQEKSQGKSGVKIIKAEKKPVKRGG